MVTNATRVVPSDRFNGFYICKKSSTAEISGKHDSRFYHFSCRHAPTFWHIGVCRNGGGGLSISIQRDNIFMILFLERFVRSFLLVKCFKLVFLKSIFVSL
jgi:hypothetical protein